MKTSRARTSSSWQTRRLGASLGVATALLLAACAPNRDRVDKTQAGLSTRNNQIVTTRGVPVVLRGVDEGRLDIGSGSARPDACNQRYVEVGSEEGHQLVNWGFNAVRLAVSWENLEPQPPSLTRGGIVRHWNRNYLVALDRAVRTFTSAGLYVIVDLHQSFVSPAFTDQRKGHHLVCEGEGFPKWMFPEAKALGHDRARCLLFQNRSERGVVGTPYQAMAAAWRLLARRYSHNTRVVGADLFNEPDAAASCLHPGNSVLELYRHLARAIRNVDPNWLVVAEDNSNFGPTGATMLPSLNGLGPNVVYEVHLYQPSLSDALAALRRALARAHKWNVPLYIGEFDGFGGDTAKPTKTDRTWQRDLRRFLSVLSTDGTSWTLWEYAGTESLVFPATTIPKQPLLSILQHFLPGEHKD